MVVTDVTNCYDEVLFRTKVYRRDSNPFPVVPRGVDAVQLRGGKIKIASGRK